MRRLAANYIFPISSSPIKNGYIEFDNSGKITQMEPLEKEIESTEFYNGIICPDLNINISEFHSLTQSNTSIKDFFQTINKNTRYVFEIGKAPGAILIKDIDLKELRLTTNSSIIKLI